MMKKYLMFLVLSLFMVSASAYDLKRVSVHDPSVVWDPASQTYYIFGSHRAAAKSTDLMSWTQLNAPFAPVTGNAAYDWSAAYGNYSVDGNMWAPDVIWNPAMQKWCMYLSINGPKWNSSIVLMTSDNIEGPYQYQAPVVFSGFNVTNTEGVSYKNTDLEKAIGSQASLPARYNVGDKWGERWPHCIDPCVFYDEEGRLWMSYGSWSGGIWMLELDEATGLRDYNVTYELTGEGNGITVDPYFGKKIAGGYYVSGEASYIEYIGGWYFLFVTYGGLAAGGDKNDYNNGGYQMRVFRSEKPDGPYLDARNTDAIFSNYKLNFGPDANDNRGVNIFGAYSEWGNVAKGNHGERSQGHNSIIAAEDGRTYLVYHTRFQNRGEEHEVRVHQVFQNEDGWLCAAPFEYTGEEVKSADIATTQQVATDRIPGTYQFLLHPFKLNHMKKEAAKPVDIELKADGTISGEKTGTWAIQEGTSYIAITIDNHEYKGVVVEQTMEKTTDKTVAFTAVYRDGTTIWGYNTDVTSGIRTIQRSEPDDAWYTLSGQRITAPNRPGIYIHNNRKVIIPAR